MYRVSIDVGGTFTDCLVLDERRGDLRQFKAPTTPADPSVGCIDAVAKAAMAYGLGLSEFLALVELLIHGTTLATNTLINEDGAKTGMITTKHFRDMLEIRRGHKNVRVSMYNVFIPPYKPLIPRRLRLEAEERVLYTGEVLTALDEDDVREASRRLRQEGVESVAIGFLHSYANPGHEARAAEIVREELGDDVYVTTSAEILPVWREWERFSTTAVSAYTGPAVKRYLLALEERLATNGFAGSLMMMLSDGLVETVENCIPRAVYLIGSGPAAGARRCRASRIHGRSPEPVELRYGGNVHRHRGGDEGRDPHHHRGMGPGRAGRHQDGGHRFGGGRGWLDRLGRLARSAAGGAPLGG